ncbi:MAG: 50S ribosomal protein L11 methyltransferase, partial [Clostridia bacterium]|nr:50S ribosomal protein L11 methyltransferase [Clostridia bacterium]
ELGAEICWELGSSGVSIIDPRDWESLKPEEKVTEEKPAAEVKAYFAEKVDPRPLLNNYKLSAQIVWQLIKEDDWRHEWKKYYHPLRVGRKFFIKPVWEEAEDLERLTLVIEPGVSFGSGTHPSTQLCLEFLENYITPESRVFDVGCGSGILAMAAAKLGAAQVWAVDNDPLAVKAAKENFQLNALQIEVVEGDLLRQAKGRANLIVANIVAEVIIQLAPTVAEFLEDGGLFIASGIYYERETEVEKFLTARQFELMARKREGEWTALAVRKR